MRTSLPARTILIAGPPCSGKTQYVAEHRGPDDMVLDFDTIARDLGSPVLWLHPQPYRALAEQTMRTQLSALPGSGPHTAWVIRSAAPARVRAIAAKKIRATQCIVINPGLATCLDRAAADSRPDGTVEEIRRWYAKYTPWSGDTLVAPAPPALTFFDTPVEDTPPASLSQAPPLAARHATHP